MEDKVLEKTDNSTGRKNELSKEHYKELYLKKKKHHPPAPKNPTQMLWW